MHDIVIRGGTVYDGTGDKSFTGDIAIDGDKIAAVGGKAGPGRREIDANGLMVTPGFVDVHTHFDGQATWDPLLAPSCLHGVTTVMFGNCGVGFAPVRNTDHQALIDLMEAVEDIPGITLTEGLKWDWESFPEFLDALDRMPRVMDIGAQVPHHPLRVYVMGDRAIRHEAATPDDVAAMRKLTEDGLRAGAFGFTTSRTDAHKTLDGGQVPARYSMADELVGIGRAIKAVGHGTFGMTSDFDDEAGEFEWMTRLGRETGCPVWFVMTDINRDPQRWRRLIAGVAKARADGAQLTAQVCGRPVGVLLGIGTSLNPFSIRPSYAQVEHLPLTQRIERLRDPEVRRQILADQPSPEMVSRLTPFRQTVGTHWHNIFLMGDPLDYEPPPSASIAAVAEREGRPPQEVAYDYLVAGEHRFLLFPVANYAVGDLSPVHEMLQDPNTMIGLSDAGAHCGSIIDASLPTYMLTHWGRDRSRGPKLPLERLVRLQTSHTAEFFGIRDRGRLKPGMRADVNLIDFDRLSLKMPEIVHDLPAGGRRMMQRAEGYVATLAGGQVVFENSVHTGALPGKLLRAGR